MKATTTIDLKRAVVIRRPWVTIRRWRTRDNRHAIDHSRIEYGRDCAEPCPDVYRVLACDAIGWTIISKHRKRSAAVKALGDAEKHRRRVDRITRGLVQV